MKAATAVEGLLRSDGRFAPDSGELPLRVLTIVFLGGAALYGLILGSYGGRPLQMTYSMAKLPLLLFGTTLICLPNFFVLNVVLGLAAEFGRALKAIIAAQATFAITLASLGPMTGVAYASTVDYRWALNLNGVPFAVALLAGHVTLSRHYRPLIARSPRHRVPLWSWLFLYALVAMQMAWGLRPFVGDPSLPSRFLRPDAWSNAYIEIWSDLVVLAGG